MKKLKLTQNKFALLDEEDYFLASKYKWCAVKRGQTFYARRNLPRNGGEAKKEYLHRFIMKPPQQKEVDHINGNGLDNRKVNLRICTREQNSRNKKQINKSNTGIKGISWCENRKRFFFSIGYKGKTIALGRYISIEEATKVIESERKKLHKEFARL